MTKVVGVSFALNTDGVKKSTIYVVSEFDSYYTSGDGKRGCVGNMTEAIYVGELDVSHIKPGMIVEIVYGKAISTRNGMYQPIQKVDVVNNGKQQT